MFLNNKFPKPLPNKTKASCYLAVIAALKNQYSCFCFQNVGYIIVATHQNKNNCLTIPRTTANLY